MSAKDDAQSAKDQCATSQGQASADRQAAQDSRQLAVDRLSDPNLDSGELQALQAAITQGDAQVAAGDQTVTESADPQWQQGQAAFNDGLQAELQGNQLAADQYYSNAKAKFESARSAYDGADAQFDQANYSYSEGGA